MAAHAPLVDGNADSTAFFGGATRGCRGSALRRKSGQAGRQGGLGGVVLLAWAGLAWPVVAVRVPRKTPTPGNRGGRVLSREQATRRPRAARFLAPFQFSAPHSGLTARHYFILGFSKISSPTVTSGLHHTIPVGSVKVPLASGVLSCCTATHSHTHYSTSARWRSTCGARASLAHVSDTCRRELRQTAPSTYPIGLEHGPVRPRVLSLAVVRVVGKRTLRTLAANPAHGRGVSRQSTRAHTGEGHFGLYTQCNSNEPCTGAGGLRTA